MGLLKYFCLLLFLSLTLLNSTIFSQDSISYSQLKNRINVLEKGNSKITSDLEKLNSELNIKLNSLSDSLKMFKSMLKENNNALDSISGNFSERFEENKVQSDEQISSIDKSLSKNTLYWIIAVLAIAILSILLFLILRKQMSKEKSDITANILQTKKVLEEEGLNLDKKLVDLLATQLQLMKEEQKIVPPSKIGEVDHELALKVADEIIRIQKNLFNMDPETKGLKQLSASVKRIQDNFEANGYELVEMLNKPYDQGMKVIANFKPDDNLKENEQIITRIIKPQVNYKGIMIQAAQIEVSQG